MRYVSWIGVAGACRIGLALLTLSAAVVAAGARPEETELDTWFPRLRVGMWVSVEGKPTPDGIMQGFKIKVYAGELDEVEVESYVAAIDLARMTVETTAGVRVVATPKTEVEAPKTERHVSLAFLEVGDRVEVEGQLQKDGTLLAEKIDIERSKQHRPDSKPENKHELKGRIESIDAAGYRIAVLGIPVQLSEGTRLKSPLPY